MMSSDDDQAFREAMSDVVPLEREPRAARPRRASSGDPSLAHRREAAVQAPQADRNKLTDM